MPLATGLQEASTWSPSHFGSMSSYPSWKSEPNGVWGRKAAASRSLNHFTAFLVCACLCCCLRCRVYEHVPHPGNLVIIPPSMHCCKWQDPPTNSHSDSILKRFCIMNLRKKICRVLRKKQWILVRISLVRKTRLLSQTGDSELFLLSCL